jgi:uncharacterized protein YcaQ
MPARSELSSSEARALALTAQGLGRPRPSGPVGRRQLRTLMTQIGQIQVDAINVVARTQFIVPFSRLGAYDRRDLFALSAPRADWFEYWGHAASLMPVDTQPLLRWRMAIMGPFGESPKRAAARRAFRSQHADYISVVLAEVRDRGPIPASQLTDPRRQNGEWWDRRSLGRQALEALFSDGELVGWRTENFERVYDLPERALPATVVNAPTPADDEAQRQLLMRAARALGVATERDLASYYTMAPRPARTRVRELVDAGDLVAVKVEGWRDAAYMVPGTRVTKVQRAHGTLLSPFDSLIWERARTSRLFGFDYTIEVYVPEPKRKYGYFVLPLLLGDALVARFDLKADRKLGALRVRGSYLEPGVDAPTVAPAAITELRALQEFLELDRVVVERRGNFAGALARAAR